MLEVSFFLNLAVVGASVLYVNFIDSTHETNAKTAAVSTSVFIVFLKFIGIVMYHLWRTVTRYRRSVTNRKKGYQNLDMNCDAVIQPTTTTVAVDANGKSKADNQDDPLTYKSSQVREPLLTETTI